jgi:hypothetical protein
MEDRAPVKARFNEQEVMSSDILGLGQSVTCIFFCGCTSKEWAKVGESIFALPNLSRIEIHSCRELQDLFSVPTDKRLELLLST